MNGKTAMGIRSILCMATAMVFWGLFLAAPAWCTTSDEALLRSEERRRAIAQRMERSTVLILVTKDGELQSLGTGFVVADGHVMTNAHVVDSGDDWYIAGEGLPPVESRLIKRQHSEDTGVADFALLKFSSPVTLPPLSFNTQVGRMDRVSAWGYPYMVTQFDQRMDAISEGNFEGMPPLVYTEGVVSAIVHGAKSKNIIHSAAIAAGNSGGPLINSWGEVVGINTWGYVEEDEGAFINASLPADAMVDFLKSCGIEPQLSQRSTSTLQASLPPPSAQPPSVPIPLETEEQKAPRRSSLVPTENTTSPPSGLAPDEQELWHMAIQGDVDAQAALGFAYFLGENAPKDMSLAMTWLQKAVAQENNDARFMLGYIYIFEDGYTNIKAGLDLLTQAADNDVDYASTVALLFFCGERLGVTRDWARSAMYAASSAKTGDEDAIAVLAFMDYFGEDEEQKSEEALELARQAEKKESALALALLGWMYYIGDVVPENPSRAISYATDAAESGEAHGMGLLAYMHLNGAENMPVDKEKAEGWALRAAEQCNEYGLYVLGMLYKDETSEQKQVEAWAYLDMAARNLVEAEKERDALAKTMSDAQLRKAHQLSAERLSVFRLPSTQ